jgi:hypothetical protein
MMGVRAIPVVLVIVVMIYWLVRIRSKRRRPMRMLEPAR